MSTHLHEPVGRCIYCHETKGVLSDEHIIPLALGGIEILPNASCERCSTITGRFEGFVLRGVYGDLRIHFNLPTRRKKQRPTTATIETAAGETVDVPVREFPLVFFVYNFDQCGFLTGKSPYQDVSNFSLSTLHNGEDLQAFTAKYGWNSTIQKRLYPNEFRKMIAKIGHSYLTALVGHGEFRPLALKAIRKKHFNMSYLVGQNPDIEPIVVGDWFNVRFRMFHPNSDKSTTYVKAEIRLFQSNPLPTYHAIIGKIEGAAQYGRVLAKLRDGGRVEVLSPSG